MFSRVHFYAYEMTAIYYSCLTCMSFFLILRKTCHTIINLVIQSVTSVKRDVNFAGSPKADELESVCHPHGSVAAQGLSPLL